ncbi:hypothetical protein, partial [uncultured Selenomonas sp.]|uniref:hypothetical protein n=1 Tax=uncultured Selenomonas sp. TaxID=159275 RepID=UPI002805ED15
FRTSKTKSASVDENIHQLMRFFLPVDNSSSENHSFFSGLLEWHVLFRAFAEFAALARQHHFYEAEIEKMEASLLEMSPYPDKKESD